MSSRHPYDDMESDTCGVAAVVDLGMVECCAQFPRPATDVVVRQGCEVRVCPSCWVWASMDAQAAPDPEVIPVVPEEVIDDGVYGWCWDCERDAAEIVFNHLDGREIPLCSHCWLSASHEPDYLVFCECAIPRLDVNGWQCAECHFEIQDTRAEPVVDSDSESEPECESESESESESEAEDVDEESWSYPSVDI